MFFFNIHPNQKDLGNHALYSKGWSVKMFNSIGALAEMCTSHLNAPVIWSCGVRKQANFIYADFVVVDVDDDSKMSLDAAIERYSRFVHVIGTTKSDGLLKGNRIGARYRIFVAAEKRITSPVDYRNLCLQEAHLCGGDWQASCPAQQFMPLKRIVSYAEIGRRLPNEIKFASKRVEMSVGSCSTGGFKKEIPRYIQRWLEGEVSIGQRNLTVFKAACGLKKRNFSEDEILEIVLSSSLPLDKSAKTVQEVKSAVRSAMRRK